MKITKASVIVCSPGRNYVTLRIETDEGIVGLGDATLNGRELAVASYLDEYLIPCIEGRDAFDTEDIWHYLYKGVYWRRGPVNMTAIGAIDMALWDIKGKMLGVPVYQLLGGKSRSKLLAYTHAQGENAEQTIRQVEKILEKGYKAVRAQVGIPGLKKVYGISDRNRAYEPAKRSLQPVEEVWNTSTYLNAIPDFFEKLRKAFGEQVHLLHDAHHRLTPIEAARLGKALEPYHLYWLEDAVAAENQDGLKYLRNHTTTPLAFGEVFNSIYDCKDMISKGYVDFIRMTVAHGGGFTPMMKIASFCELYHVRMACHGPSDLSPVNLAACLHFGTAVNNFGIQEYMGYPEEASDVFNLDSRLENGFFKVSSQPGLGVDFDLEKAKKYPYQKAYLPVNRLEDGTIFNW